MGSTHMTTMHQHASSLNEAYTITTVGGDDVEATNHLENESSLPQDDCHVEKGLVIVSSCYGSYGDVLPMIGFAKAIQNRGHEVAFVTHDYFREVAEKCGLAVRPIGDKESYAQLLNNPEERYRNPKVGR